MCERIRRSNRKPVLLGSYPTEVQAAVACDDATKQAAINGAVAAAGSSSAASAATSATLVTSISSSITGSAPPSPSPSTSGSVVGPDKSQSINFDSDQEAQERLNALAMFEAGFDPATGAEVDASLMLVFGKGGKWRRRKKQSVSLSANGTGGVGSDNGGNDVKGKLEESPVDPAGGDADPMEVEQDGQELEKSGDAGLAAHGDGGGDRYDGCAKRCGMAVLILIYLFSMLVRMISSPTRALFSSSI